jgi:predicted ATPase
VWLVELAPLSDPALVPQVVASVFGVRETPGITLAELLMDCLRSRKTLLILDNCEHLVEAYGLGTADTRCYWSNFFRLSSR